MSPPTWARPRASRVPPWLRWALRIVFTVGVTWIIARQLGVGLDDALALDRGIPELDRRWIAASVGALLGTFLLAAGLWGRMVRDLGEPDPGVAASARVIFTANLGRYVPGKVWQIAGLAILARRQGVSVTIGTLAGILVQGFSLLAAAAWGIPAITAVRAEASDGLWLLVGIGIATVVLLCSVPTLLHGVFRFLFRLARRDPEEAPRTDVRFGLRWLGWHLVVWAGYGVAFHLFLVGLGFDELGILSSTIYFAAAYLLGYLALPAPAGLGVREGVLMALLQPVIGPAAAPVAILARLWMTAVELAPAGALALWEALRNPTESEAAGKGGETRP
ncbi:MAG: UPF0104 family protein [Gemmatimonadales bacterium]|nr:MAG: UPF0104 family protein [Gemmatimonadales bacterium]